MAWVISQFDVNGVTWKDVPFILFVQIMNLKNHNQVGDV